jgi:hypothetical protein
VLKTHPPLPRGRGHGPWREGGHVEGTPQGSPLSPLLANIMLDDLDHELARRGHALVRDADDLRVYVASERAAARVPEGVSDFTQQRLNLRVNRQKSGSPGRPAGASWARVLQGRGAGEGPARSQGKGRLKFRLHPSPRPAGRCPWPPVWLPSTGSLPAGARTLGWPRRRRCSPSSTSGCADGCGKCAGRSGRGSPRGAATSGRSASQTGRQVNGHPAGTATGGSRGSAPLQRPVPNRYWADLGLVAPSDRSVASGRTGEPPHADPPVRCCGRGRANLDPSPISVG